MTEGLLTAAGSGREKTGSRPVRDTAVGFVAAAVRSHSATGSSVPREFPLRALPQYMYPFVRVVRRFSAAFAAPKRLA